MKRCTLSWNNGRMDMSHICCTIHLGNVLIHTIHMFSSIHDIPLYSSIPKHPRQYSLCMSRKRAHTPSPTVPTQEAILESLSFRLTFFFPGNDFIYFIFECKIPGNILLIFWVVCEAVAGEWGGGGGKREKGALCDKRFVGIWLFVFSRYGKKRSSGST